MSPEQVGGRTRLGAGAVKMVGHLLQRLEAGRQEAGTRQCELGQSKRREGEVGSAHVPMSAPRNLILCVGEGGNPGPLSSWVPSMILPCRM